MVNMPSMLVIHCSTNKLITFIVENANLPGHQFVRKEPYDFIYVFIIIIVESPPFSFKLECGAECDCFLNQKSSAKTMNGIAQQCEYGKWYAIQALLDHMSRMSSFSSFSAFRISSSPPLLYCKQVYVKQIKIFNGLIFFIYILLMKFNFKNKM